MAFDASLPIGAVTAGSRESFLRYERLVALSGAVALGALLGFSATVMSGRHDLWVLLLTASVTLVVGLHLTAKTLSDALRRDARGCAMAAMLHGAALLAWPMTCLLIPLQPGLFWIAPALAMSSLVLFASCWGGPSRAVYRTMAQGALVGALAAHQGVLVVMGG